MENVASPTIKIKTENEHILYTYYQREKAANQELQTQVQTLQEQLNNIQQQFEQLLQEKQQPKQSPIKDPMPNNSSQCAEYCTDEEELAKETEWVRVKNRKKRKLNTTPSPPSKSTSGNENTGQIKAKKSPQPPPVIVDGIKNYQKFYDFLVEGLSGDPFTVKMLNGDSVKVNANNEEAYRLITKHLSANNCLWHSYENKQDRPIRVVAKNLHHTCKPERILEDLQFKGYKIESAVNKLRWKNKEPLNLFILTFKNEEDISKIYAIKNILGCKVEIQSLKSPKIIPQCKRCQAYGHTQKYCAKEPRCVKCTGKHLTKDCTRPATDKPKCVHCGDPHPANYRGCIVAKELQKYKNKNMKKKTSIPSQSVNANAAKPTKVASAAEQPCPSSKTRSDVSYAQMMTKQTTNNANSESDMELKINKILKFMTMFDERLKKLENSTKEAIYKQRS